MVSADRRPEARELPAEPDDKPLPEGIPREPGEDHVVPLERGQCVSEDGSRVAPGPCPDWSGIAVSEARAARDALYRISYTELRRLYEADRQVWAAHRELYEAQIREDRKEIERLQPDWWERHDGTVIGVGAFIVGAALTVGVVSAVDHVTD